jgi:type VI secretion system protein ImpH
MATPQRTDDALEGARSAELLELLGQEGNRFGFFQAVQLLHRLVPGAVPVGELGPAGSEAVRFRHDPQLIFHAGDVAGIRVRTREDGSARVEMTTTFLGLFGSASPLGTVFCEEVLRAEAQDETALRAFYDMLHHRLISLFYRSWKKYRFHVGFHTDASDTFSRRMLAFVGVDVAGRTPSRGLRPFEALAFAPLLAMRTRPARTLQLVLEWLLPGTKVSVEPFALRRVQIRVDDRCMLGQRNNVLSNNFAIGRTVADRSGRFRVVVGPVDYATFDALMPGGSRHAHVRDVIVRLSPAHVEPELELVLGAEHTPRFRLGSERGGRLGVTTHLPIRQGSAMRARVVLSEDLAEAVPRLFSDEHPPDSVAAAVS